MNPLDPDSMESLEIPKAGNSSFFLPPDHYELDPQKDFQFVSTTLLELYAQTEMYWKAKIAYNRYPEPNSFDIFTIRQVIMDYVLNNILKTEGNGADAQQESNIKFPVVSAFLGEANYSRLHQALAKFLSTWEIGQGDDELLLSDQDPPFVTAAYQVSLLAHSMNFQAISLVAIDRSEPQDVVSRKLFLATFLLLVVLALGVVGTTIFVESTVWRGIAVGAMLLVMCSLYARCMLKHLQRTDSDAYKLWSRIIGPVERLSRPPEQITGTKTLAFSPSSSGGLIPMRKEAPLVPRLAVKSRTFNASALPQSFLTQGCVIFDSNSAFDISALHANLVMIGINASNLKITAWNSVAERITGFSHTDTLGQHILNFLKEDHFEDMRRFLIQASKSETGMLSKLQTIEMFGASKLNVKFRGMYIWLLKSAASIHDLESDAIILGTPIEESNSYQKHGLLLFLMSEARSRGNMIASAITSGQELESKFHQDILRQLFDLASSENVTLLTLRMSQWRANSLSNVLLPITRQFLEVMDVSIDKKVAEVLLCDPINLGEIVQTILEKVTSTKSLLTVTQHEEVNGMCTVVFSFSSTGVTPAIFSEICLSEGLAQRLANCGAILSLNPANEDVVLLAPMLLGKVGDYTNFATPSSSMSSSNLLANGEPLTFLAYETTELGKHTLSALIWEGGHGLFFVDNKEQAKKTLAKAVVDCAIIETDTEFGKELFTFVRDNTENILLITVGINRSGFSVPHLSKPYKKSALDAVEKQAQFIAKQRKEKLSQMDSMRKLFKTEKSSPWKKGGLVGRGTFGEVYEATNLLTGDAMAVKIISEDRFEDPDEVMKQIINEIEIMYALDHPNIVRYLYCEKEDKALNIFMELCGGGSLRSLLEKQPKNALSLGEARDIIKDITAAVAYLHAKEIVHRDLKPENILISNGKIKLSDFGTAVRTTKGTKMTDTAGTFRYMAPEVFNGDPYGAACDIWSIGVIFMELMGQLPPFLKDANGVALSAYYSDLAKTDSVPLPGALFGDARSFVKLCLQVNQIKRPMASSLLMHPLFVEDPDSRAFPTFRSFRASSLHRQSLTGGDSGGGAMNEYIFPLESPSNTGFHAGVGPVATRSQAGEEAMSTGSELIVAFGDRDSRVAVNDMLEGV